MFPGRIPVAFQLPEINRSHRQGTVVQEAAYLLHRLSGLPPKLGRRVAENVDPRWRQSSLEVPAQVAVEGAASDSSPAVGAGWPQGLVGLQGGEILAEGFQGLQYGPERRSLHPG